MIIPKNILFEHDILPIEFFRKFNIQYRQIPYFSVSIIGMILIYKTNNNVNLYILDLIPSFLSFFSLEDQYFEELIINYFIYIISKIKGVN